MQLHEIRRPPTLTRPAQRVGRGQGSGRGKQSGRGGKGQTARAGAKIRPAWRDIIKKLPRRRGFGKNRGRTVVGTRPPALTLSIFRLDQLFDSGSIITRSSLKEKGVVSRKFRPVKIVGFLGESETKNFDKKFTIKGIAISASARAAIEKAGGTIV